MPVLGSILIVLCVVAALSFSFLAGYYLGRSKQTNKSGHEEVLVKREVPSFRSPAKTTKTTYERYKSSNGLYAPVRMGKGSTADEMEVK